MPTDNNNWISKASLASSIGLVIAISVFIGWGFGSWLDSKFHTTPWLMLLFTLMGIVAGFIEMINIAKQISKDD